MKTYWKRFVAMICVVALLFSFGSLPGLAYAGPQAPASPNCEWSELKDVFLTFQEKDTFRIDIATYVEDIFRENLLLYITFPVEGGFRFNISEDETKRGFFNPSALSDITYQTLDDGRLMMYGTGDTVLYYNKTATGFVMSVGDKKGNISLTFTNENIHLGYQGMDIVRTKMTLPLAKDEAIYNGSERFNDVNQVGYTFSLRNVDAAYHGSNDASKNHTDSYINVPIFHSSEGYSVWYNMTYTGTADIGDSDHSAYTVDFDGGKFDFYMWNGTILENIKKYTAITGTSIVPPKWAFGYWLGAQAVPWRTNQTTGKTYTDGSAEAIQQAYDNLVDMFEGYEAMGITDIAAVYGEGLNSTSNTAAYNYVNSRGSRMLMWYHPHAYTVSTLQMFLPGVSRNNLPLPLNLVNPVAGNFMGDFIDFSHPNAVNAITGFFNGGTSYSKNLKYWDLGLKGAMVDYGEWMEDAVLCYNGLKGDEMHNFVSYYYAKAMAEAWDSYYPDHDYILFERSGVAGSQRFIANFTGDQKANWEGLKDQIHGILSMSMGGFNIVGGDMGGFSGQPSNELYTRWVQFSAFSPLMRTHGQIKNPWDKGDVAKSSFSTYYWMRMNMQDLLYSAAVDANKNATPMTMPLGVAYQGQKNVKSINDQYLFCNSLLVNPVTTQGATSRSVWLPEGHWYDLWTGERIAGNTSVTAIAPTETIPVYLKSGAAVAVELPDTMKIATSMQEKTRYKALLITPADNLTVTPVYTSADGAPTVYTSRYIDTDCYTLTADMPSNRRMLIAYGTNAATVEVDGIALQKLSRIPDITKDTSGYYTDGAGKTYILTPAGWQNVYINSRSLAVTSNIFSSSVAGLLGYNTTKPGAYPNGMAYATYSSSTAALQNAFLAYMGSKYDFYYTDYDGSKMTYTKRASFISTEKGWSANAIFINRYLQLSAKNDISELPGTALRQLAVLVPKGSDGNALKMKNFKATFGLRFEKTFGSVVFAFRQMTPAGFFESRNISTTQTYIKVSPDDIVLYDRGTTTVLHTYGKDKPASTENNRNMTVSVTVCDDTLTYTVMADYKDTTTVPTVSGTVKISNAGIGYMALAMAGAYNGISLLSVDAIEKDDYPVISTDSTVKHGRFDVSRVSNVADENGCYEYKMTVCADAGYELKAGSLVVIDAEGNVQVPINSSFRNGGKGTEFTFRTKTNAKICGYFYKPNKTLANTAMVGTSYNAEQGGLRFVYRIQRKLDGGKEYMLLDGEWKEMADYGVLVALDTVVGTRRLDVELAETNAYVQKHSVKQANRYYDTTDAYVDVCVQVVNLDTMPLLETMDIVANAYVELADGTYLYANGYTANYALVANA